VTEADRSLPAGYRAQLAGPSYEGIATFAQRPLLTETEELDRWHPDVAIVGAPWDDSTTNRPGARFGPRALRALAYSPGTFHLDLGVEIFDSLEVIDFGDAHCPHGLVEVSHAAIRERVGAIASRGIVPVVLGGDHSITWPSATAVAEAHGWGRIGIVHFDAHADTADRIDGNLASHGTPMRRLIESGAVLGRNFVQVGLRGYWPDAATFAWMREQEMRYHFMQEVWERGLAPVIDDAVEEALEGCDAIYVSVDIDVLDPAFAPGTGTPEPGGIAPVDLLRAIRRLAMDTPLVALDVVEVAPAYDWAEVTVNNAHRVVLEALAGLAVRRGAQPTKL
jgi:guanidinobutyrase